MERTPCRSLQNPTSDTCQSLRLRQMTLASAQCLLGVSALSDIRNRADHFNKLSIGTHYWMAQATNVFDRAIRQHDSFFGFGIYLLDEHPIAGLPPDFIAIFWVHPLQPLLPLRKALLRIKSENPEHFLGIVLGLAGCAIESPTTRVGQPLRFR